jgi:ATP-dependent Clp protease ATP-binding subunit ClpC
MVDSTDLAQVLGEAQDIAQSVSQRLTSAHVLLALFTVENRAQFLLRERGVDEDRFLQVMTSAPQEAEGLVRELCERAREIARNCGSLEADCLHLLIAATRVRCCAQELMSKVGLDLSSLRNTALSYFLSGRMPRKLQLGKTPALPSDGRRPAAALPQARTRTSSTLSLTARDLVDDERQSEQELLETALGAPEPAPMARPAPPPAPRNSPGTGRLGLSPENFPLLASLGRNLSVAAAEGKLDPVVGRGREVEEVIDILGKRRTNNPCLLGEPGVGKTAIVEGVAQQLVRHSGALGEKILVELDVATLVAGTQLRGSFSERHNGLKEEVRRAEGQVVVFIDEIHTLVGAGATGEGPQDAANELKAAMARGEFPCIGATTHEEFRKHIASDAALERRFTPVRVDEPSVGETLEILQGIIARYEEHHGLRYSPAALRAAATLSARYVHDRFLPDKAISLVDLAGSRCRREGKEQVDAPDIARVVSKLVGIPEERLLTSDSARLLHLEKELAQRVVGHSDVVAKVAAVLRRNYAGFASRRPMGSFLFLGPTGVGKTELARALAQVLFGSENALVSLDMSEMSESHSTAKLVGAPAGYVGYGDGGQLTEPVRKRPSCVVLLDEIEKAHRDVLMLLLQVLEEGRLTDGKGRQVDFSNSVVVLTTNLGADAFHPLRRVGFGADQGNTAAPLEEASGAARQALPAELWNRIDERLTFRPLAQGEIAAIADRLLVESSQRLSSEKGIEYFAEADVVQHLLASGGFDPKLGARPMRQVVQRLVEAPLAERILSGEFGAGDRVRVAMLQGQLSFSRARRV